MFSISKILFIGHKILNDLAWNDLHIFIAMEVELLALFPSKLISPS